MMVRRAVSTLAYIFVGLPLAFSALFLLSVRPWALDRETYRRFVQDERLYTALRAPELASRAPATLEPPALKGLPAEARGLKLSGPALVAAAQKDLPWPEVKATALRAVDAVYEAATTRAGRQRPLELDLKSLKAALRKGAPALARDYAADAKAAGASLPKGADSPQAMALLLGAYVDAMPDTARVEPPALPAPRGPAALPAIVMSRGPGMGGDLTQALLNRMTATTVAMSALLLAGLGALGGTSLASRLSRAGRFVLLPSVVVLVLGAVLAIPGGLLLQNALPPEIRAMVEGSAGAQLRAYLASALGPIARSFFLTGLVGASLGGVLAQARRFGERKELE
jgi:hypothetical protein